MRALIYGQGKDGIGCRGRVESITLQIKRANTRALSRLRFEIQEGRSFMLTSSEPVAGKRAEQPVGGPRPRRATPSPFRRGPQLSSRLTVRVARFSARGHVHFSLCPAPL